MMMRVPQIALATALALSTWMTVAPARAAEPGPDTLPIHVIAVQTNDADDQAEALTKALRNAVRAMPGWSLGEGDYSLEVLALSLKCAEPPDASCQSRIADQIRTDRYVWGVLNKGKNNNVSGELNFWVRGKGTNQVKVDYSANLTEPADESLMKVANDSINKLTGGPPKGEVKIKAGSVNGQVFVDGQPLGALASGEGMFYVPAGSHQLVVKAPGYSDMSTTITVKPSSPTDVVVAPVAAPDNKPVNWKRIGGFAGLGAGAVFAAVGVAGTVKVVNANGSIDKDVRGQFTTEENICSAAQTKDPRFGSNLNTVLDACSAGKSGQIMQFIFYPLAALSAGAGVYLLVTSGSAPQEAPKTGWKLIPRFDTQSGKLDVRFTF